VRTAGRGEIGLTFSVFCGGKTALRERVGLPHRRKFEVQCPARGPIDRRFLGMFGHDSGRARPAVPQRRLLG
jgi:hypothetical protein